MKKMGLGIAGLAGLILGGSIVEIVEKKNKKSKSKNVDQNTKRLKSYYDILNKWLSMKQKGESLEKYFLDYGYKSVAIYGMGELGKRLYDELKDTSIKVLYAIDKNSGGKYLDIDIKSPDEKLPEVDVTVVTAVFAFDEILLELEDKLSSQIISLNEVL